MTNNNQQQCFPIANVRRASSVNAVADAMLGIWPVKLFPTIEYSGAGLLETMQCAACKSCRSETISNLHNTSLSVMSGGDGREPVNWFERRFRSFNELGSDGMGPVRSLSSMLEQIKEYKGRSQHTQKLIA